MQQLKLFFRTSYYLLIFFLLSSLTFSTNQEPIHYRANGSVHFISTAPLEIIEATSANVKGIIDRQTGEFAFSLAINTFEGFNSPLQREHFNEHYLESRLYPKATFTGKIIGFSDCKTDCEESIKAKGKFNIHNITQVMIIPVTFKRKNNQVNAKAKFDVKLEDFDIAIPKILESKIAPIVQVDVELNLSLSNE